MSSITVASNGIHHLQRISSLQPTAHFPDLAGSPCLGVRRRSMKTSITLSPVAFWLEFTSVNFVLTPLTLFVGLLLVLTRGRTRPFPWLIVVLRFAPVFVWFATWQVFGILRGPIS
jgi:hypothetical protein